MENTQGKLGNSLKHMRGLAPANPPHTSLDTRDKLSPSRGPVPWLHLQKRHQEVNLPRKGRLPPMSEQHSFGTWSIYPGRVPTHRRQGY